SFDCPPGDGMRASTPSPRAPRGWPGSPMGIPSGRPAGTMATATYRVFDPLLPRAPAERMLRLCERFGAYGMYSQEASEAQIGQGLFQRHDAVMNFLKTGGRFGRHDSIESLGARTNYFRESYAYGDEVRIDGIEPFLRYEGFVEAARAIHGRPVVEPAIVYANLLVPGQELAVHTDVPEFRGANRKRYPQWLMVVVHHGDAVVAGYGWDEMRFSISWKAYCFTDAEERRAWRDHREDLVLERILDRLVEDLRARGRLESERPDPTSLALILIDEYVK